jgi:hypothetical protein
MSFLFRARCCSAVLQVAIALPIDLLITFASESHACLLASRMLADSSSKQAHKKMMSMIFKGHACLACAVAMLITFFLRP